MMDTQRRAELARSIASLALLRGTFTLRSGRASSYYLDKYRFTTRPEVLQPVGELIADEISRLQSATGSPVHRLAGAELGGIPLVTAAGLATGKPTIFVRNQKKDYGTAKQIEGVLEPRDRIVFVEDVTTTGGQALEAVGMLRELGAEVAAVITVIDRQEGASVKFDEAGVPFIALFTKNDLGISDE